MIGLLAFFGRAIANVPYLREVYYDQIISALHITNTQLGLLSSAVGIASLVGYFFGGFLADRISSKKMIMVSGVVGGLFSLWYMALPSFPILLLIHAVLALDGTLIFWAAYVRIIRILGGSEGQGKYYGFAEGIRAGFGILLPITTTFILAQFVNVKLGMKSVLLFYAICYFATSILAAFVLVDVREDTQPDQPQAKITKADYVALLKTPGLWLVSFLIFGTYLVFSLQSYTTPYLTGMGVSNGVVSMVATFRSYGVGVIAMPLFGIMADKWLKSSAKACVIGMTLLLPCALAMLFIPKSAPVVIIIMTLAIGFLASGTRGVYYATQDEARIPVTMTGTAAGIISTIGFLPDAYVFTQVGAWLDKYPATQAYHMIWIYMAIGCLIAIAAGGGILWLALHQGTKVKSNVQTQDVA
jgi:sugar phosphate permease